MYEYCNTVNKVSVATNKLLNFLGCISRMES